MMVKYCGLAMLSSDSLLFIAANTLHEQNDINIFVTFFFVYLQHSYYMQSFT